MFVPAQRRSSVSLLRLFASISFLWAVTATLVLWWKAGGEQQTIAWLAGDAAESQLDRSQDDAGAEEDAPQLELKPKRFAEIPGFADDTLAQALPAFRRTCSRFRVFADSRELTAPIGGTVGDWRAACEAAARVPAGDDAAARSFFETEFEAFLVRDRGDARGLFTGYYEAELKGSPVKTARYRYPLLRSPGDIISVDLGAFREDLKGRRVGGRLLGKKLVPYPDRSEIVGGALNSRRLELVWVDDPVDLFFLQIQGSGRVRFEDGQVMRVGYAAQNGHAYYAVGRALIEWGEVDRSKMSMQAIRAWLEQNPERQEELLDLNRSYVFFRRIGDAAGEQGGPIGSQGVPLTPGRSLAVDRKFVPLGAPVFLEAWVPDDAMLEDPLGERIERLERRLLVAQDTGGAIRGVVRGDVFWGFGDQAAGRAGLSRGRGRYWVLLPRGFAESSDVVRIARVPPSPRDLSR